MGQAEPLSSPANRKHQLREPGRGLTGGHGGRSCREAGSQLAVCAALQSRSSARHGAEKLENWAKPRPWLYKEGAAQGEGAQR